MITLGGAMHETDYLKTSKFGLDYFGIGDLDKDQLLEYLHTGKRPEDK